MFFFEIHNLIFPLKFGKIDCSFSKRPFFVEPILGSEFFEGFEFSSVLVAESGNLGSSEELEFRQVSKNFDFR